MKFHVLTLFPEMVSQGLSSGIIGRAVEKKLFSLDVVNIRDHTLDRHGKVDDYPYGGGAGMLMQAQPVFDAYRSAVKGRKVRTVYLTPQGHPFTQKKAGEFAGEEELVLLCGHYEGIDERVLEEIVTDYVSIGDYVLTGGELAAMVVIDAVARLLPGVLGNESSAGEESFFNDLLEYPQYSRPEVWREKRVPEVLLSGNHERVRKWRLEQAKERTRRVRPDLYAKFENKQRLIDKLLKDKRNNIHIIESLRRGAGEILYENSDNLLVFDREAKVCMALASGEEGLGAMLSQIPEDADFVVVNGEFLRDALLERDFRIFNQCSQYLYTRREALPVPYKEIRRLSEEQLDYLCSHYEYGTFTYLKERVAAGFLYGAFDSGRIVGFIGVHDEGSIGFLYVEEAYRGRGIAGSLVAYVANRMLEKGWTPYGHIVEGNTASERLQEKLGFLRSGKKIWWLKNER